MPGRLIQRAFEEREEQPEGSLQAAFIIIHLSAPSGSGTKFPDALWPADKEVYQGSKQVCEQDDQYPYQLVVAC